MTDAYHFEGVDVTEKQVKQFVRGSVDGPRINRFIPRIGGGILESFMTTPMIVSRLVSDDKIMLVITDNNGMIMNHKEIQDVLDSVAEFYSLADIADIERMNVKSIEEQERRPSPKPGKPTGSKPKTNPGFVYLMKCNEFYKIGISKNPDKRLEHITPLMPYKTELIHTIATENMKELEAFLHEQLAHCRVNGEWFKLPDDELDVLMKMPQVGENNDVT